MILVPQGGAVRYCYTAPSQQVGVVDLVLRILDDDGADIAGSPFAAGPFASSLGSYRSVQLIALDTPGTYRAEWTSLSLGTDATMVDEILCVPPGSQAWQDAVFHSRVFGDLDSVTALSGPISVGLTVQGDLDASSLLIASMGENRCS